MKNHTQTILSEILQGLMRRYTKLVPEVGKITQAMIAAGMIKSPKAIENDHIAFRTLGVPNLGIQSLERIFLHLGYQKRDDYFFAEKKLNARWYAPPQDNFPRIFISELRVADLSHKAQGIIHSYVDPIKKDPILDLDLNDAAAIDSFLHSPLWPLATWEDYEELARESEYASWVICNRYYLNHFTLSIHSLPAPYDDIRNFVDFLQTQRLKLNEAGGKIKISPDGKLLQGSTMASSIYTPFRTKNGGEEMHLIPGSYVEFAERKVLAEFASLPKNQIKRIHRRDGFEAQNADKIFESTYKK